MSSTTSLQSSGSELEGEPSSRLVIGLKGLQVAKPLQRLYFKLRIGGEYFKSKMYPGPSETFTFNEKFIFNISFHSQLFDFLHVDVFERKSFRRDRHAGRMILKIAHLHQLPETFTSWFEIMDVNKSLQEILGSRYASPQESESQGAIELSISYKYQDLSYLSKSVNAQTLKNPNLKVSSFPNLIATAEDVMPMEGDDDTLSNPTTMRYLFCLSLCSPLMGEETLAAVLGIQKLLYAFGQGLGLSKMRITLAIVLLSKFYARIPIQRTRNYVTSIEFVERVTYYKKFAMAAFGWMGINYAGRGNGIILDGLKFDADTKSILQYLSLNPQDLIELELNPKELFLPCYFIAHDKGTNAIVLSIRGSMSLTDTITDLACHYLPWKGGVVHGGMLKAALSLMKKVIPRVFELQKEYKCSKVIITGHSLGAGISSLLTMMLNEEHDDVFCYCYGVPSVISTELLALSQKNIYTFNYGNDLVPRLSYGSMMDFRLMVLTASKFVRFSYTLKGDNPELMEAMHALTLCREELKAQNQHPKLVAPGIYHYFYSLDEAPKEKSFKWTVMELSDATYFSELAILPHMISHHMPKKYENALDSCLASLKRKADP